MKYKIETYCNLLGEHDCSESELIDKITVGFNNLFEATDYLFECTSPITRIIDLIPDLTDFENDDELKQITSSSAELDEFIKNQKEIGGIYNATVTAWSYYI